MRWNFEKTVGIYPVASPRFPEAATERAHQGRDIRSFGPGLGVPGWSVQEEPIGDSHH